MIKFETWNLIPIGLAVISIVLNIIQLVKRKSITKPISNSLIGLFNDVKYKNWLCYGKRNILFAPHNPHKNIHTLKWDFNDFILSMNSALSGFQEHIVAQLKELGVSDKDVFNAVDFGLTKEEKEEKKLWQKKQREEMENSVKKEVSGSQSQ